MPRYDRQLLLLGPNLRQRFAWSTVRIYGVNAPGRSHGIMVGTRGC